MKSSNRFFLPCNGKLFVKVMVRIKLTINTNDAVSYFPSDLHKFCLNLFFPNILKQQFIHNNLGRVFQIENMGDICNILIILYYLFIKYTF